MRLWAGRTYKSGTGWCLWRWTDVDTGYIVRLHILKTALKRGLGAICLHWINAPDPDPKHDHPVPFISLILRGWYYEWREYPDGRVGVYKRKWINIVGLKDRHQITAVSPGGCLTLCIMGPKKQDWRFYIEQEFGADHSVGWKDYYAKKRAEKNVGVTA